MYPSEKGPPPTPPPPVDYYNEEGRDLVMEMVGNGELAAPAAAATMMMILGESSGEDHEIKAPKKRAETWAQEETRSLIILRREMDGLFNTSKSNKRLWEQISANMKDRGFDRSPTMCTDKWRNLLKEFKKSKQQCRAGGGGPPKMSCYREMEELLKERNRCPAEDAKVDSYLQFSDKVLEDAGVPYGSVEARSAALSLDHEGLPLTITDAGTVAASGIPPWNWEDTGGNGGEGHCGRVIMVKCGNFTRKIGINGSAEAIKDAIKSAFGLRTRRAFWLEDGDAVVHSFDREMPLGTYTLHLDQGLTIKICLYEEAEQLQVSTVEKTLYTDDDLRDLLGRRGWAGLRELGGFRTIDNLDELQHGAVYEGLRLLGG
ncbi:unnamed protein product [Spirodela intermedia]|uniref:Myb-like domain-containing protein n=1 Tax=Spirodela intermedia TaxID=51605 RepID=A0A7I8L4S6_SPIIN|nr:unnamed protein product [Spirodela intermedia]